MGFFEQLVAETKRDREELFSVPFVQQTLAGNISLPGYLAFLSQAYHHVRHTVPLLMSTGATLSDRNRWLHEPLGHYIEEEVGHEEWILSDISVAGGAAEAERVRRSQPDLPCELMVAYAYDVVRRRNPIGFFGMVHVLEGTSVSAATPAAMRIREALDLGANATTYLASHGELDQDHVGFFRGLMDRVEAPEDQDWIIHCARNFFRLYGDVFRGLPTPQAD